MKYVNKKRPGRNVQKQKMRRELGLLDAEQIRARDLVLSGKGMQAIKENIICLETLRNWLDVALWNEEYKEASKIHKLILKAGWEYDPFENESDWIEWCNIFANFKRKY